jgi:DNA replication protein DnaC
VIDELGYLPWQAEAAAHLFPVICCRYEKGSIVLNSYRMRRHHDPVTSLRPALTGGD